MSNPRRINATQEQVRLLRGQAAKAFEKGDLGKSLSLLNLAKSLRTPCESIDFLRASIFCKLGEYGNAHVAIREELRYFPNNKAALNLLNTLPIKPPRLGGSEAFKRLCSQILPYTMVGPLRLQSLYDHAVDICKNGPDGNFVECGVAGGGSSGLLSAVIKEFSPSRRLFACDSFCGLPPTSEKDVNRTGINAEDCGWGAGTCAAPEASVLELCDKLGTRTFITTIKGFFEDTLPNQASSFGPISFLHMDGDWYSSTKTILENLYDRLVPGAYVQVDDFGYWAGCRKAIEEYFTTRHLAMDVNNIDGEGIWFRKK